MPLAQNPDRDSIFVELQESTYVSGGGTSNLNGMWDYVFGAGTYNRDGFGGYGLPVVSSLSGTAGSNYIDLTWNLDNTGGFDCQFVAQYWDDSQSQPISSYSEVAVDGTASTTGQYTGRITNLTNGTTYRVRVFAWNKFNNQKDFPNPGVNSTYYPVTNTIIATPQASQFTTPSVSNADITSGPTSKDVYVEINASGNQDDFQVQYRVDSGSNKLLDFTATSACKAGQATTTPEGRGSMDAFYDTSSTTIEVRARLTGTSAAASDWSTWYTVQAVSSIPSCPL